MTVSFQKARHPFFFSTHVDLTELTGLRARNLREFLAHLKTVPGAVIYHHTHRFLKQHQYLSPEPPNDFAFWAAEATQEPHLAERLAAVDTVRFSSIRTLRDRIVDIVESHLRQSPDRGNVAAGAEFYFMKSVSFVLPTPHRAVDLGEFAEALKKVSLHAIYHHVFEARLRLEDGINDFSRWLEAELGETELARAFARLDPYTHTLEALRRRLIQLTDRRIREIQAGPHGA
ncbi:hypothetical protein HY522_12600 [bacterium]|nr:hypothetical protein [bacterium]